MLASVSPKMTAHLLVFLGVLLMILSTDKCCGQTGNYLSTASPDPLIMIDNIALIISSSFLHVGTCPYQYCSQFKTYLCSTGGLVGLPCVVYNATGPIQVRWYHSQNGNPADAEELNIIAGGRYTVEESEQSRSASSRYANCTDDDQLYRNTLKFNYIEADSGSYWCRIVIDGGILLKLSEPWTVDSIESDLAVCGTGPSQTDPNCAGQITTTPVLLSTSLPAQSSVEATSEPPVTSLVMHSPVQTTHSNGCGGGTPCFVYGLAAALGSFTIILLVATVSVLVCRKVYMKKQKTTGLSVV